MRARIPAAVLGAAFLLACGEEPAEEAPRGMEQDTTRALGAADDGRLDLFVEGPVTGAQLVFVGQDSTVRPADRTDAVFVPFSTFSVERDGIPNEFPPADGMAGMLEEAGVRGGEVVIVGEPIPAGRAYAAFDYLGLGDEAALLDGGPAALESEREAETESDRRPQPATPRSADQRGELEIDERQSMIVQADWLNDRLDDPNVAVLDARPPEEFSGETPGEGIDRPGHIPGARNIFWQTLVESEDDPRLKDEAELRRIFEEAGVDPDDTVVAYCRTGGQASFLYTVARHLGYDARLYDGSFIDWSRTDYEVER